MTSFAGRPFAVFDIDGTLYRWQLFHELVQELALRDAFPREVFHEINESWNKWRGGEMSFDDYETVVVQTLMQHLPTIEPTLFDDACAQVVAQSSHKIHHYPKALLDSLRRDNYVIIAISGSQQELLELFGAKHGFDIVIGAQYERANGRFTGVITRPTIGKKPELLEATINEHQLDRRASLAIGDSDGDAALLETVERPIAFNPSEGLFSHARKAGWPIVIERKNIAYCLERQGDELVLAETIVY